MKQTSLMDLFENPYTKNIIKTHGRTHRVWLYSYKKTSIKKTIHDKWLLYRTDLKSDSKKNKVIYKITYAQLMAYLPLARG